MFSILIASAVCRRPIGSHPNVWPLYKLHTNKTNGTFTCFDRSKTILISQINDNYVDCADGSDEPGTASFPNGTFYCRNDDHATKYIPKWSVGDGICDCCDGSDELNNDHVECPNTCGNIETKKEKILNLLIKRYKKGVVQRENLKRIGSAKFEEISNHLNFNRNVLNVFDSVLGKLRQEKNENENKFPQKNEESMQTKELSENEKEYLLNMDLFSGKNKNDETIEGKSIRNNSKFIFWLYKIWRFTFLNPKKSDLNFLETVKSSLIADLSKLRDNFLDPYLMSKSIIDAALNSDNESLALIGEIFRKDEFILEFLEEFRQDSSLIGTFKKRQNDTMLFDGAEHCRRHKNLHSLVMKLICNSKNRIISVAEKNECEFMCIFASPIACDEEKIKYLNNVSVDELKSIYKTLKI